MTGALESALLDLGAHLDVPSVNDLASKVTGRLAEERAIPHPRRRAAAWIAALVAVAGATLAPAVADLLDVGAVRVEQAPPPVTAVGMGLDLGRPVALRDATAMAGFRPRVPSVLGEPEEVWVNEQPSVPVVALVFGEVVLYQVRAGLDERTVIGKFTEGAAVRRVRVGDSDGLWIDSLHAVVYLDPAGEPLIDLVRLAGPVLLWQIGDITFRLEADVPVEEAVRIAESLR
jgi:hypothetical protein